ncbi:Eukaryotic translation initiation factor 3 subunit A, partial [Trichinella papuae]
LDIRASTMKDFEMFHRYNVKNLLRKANELMADDKEELALQTLKEFVNNPNNRVASNGFRQIIIKSLHLCTELREDETAKDMLVHYRQMCQLEDIHSFADVLLYYLKLADDKARITKLRLQNLREEEFDSNEIPERLLLAMAAEEEPLGLIGHLELTPWLRFLWQSYKHCLDLLSNNQHVELLYHIVLERAFYYCLNYRRKSEFCELGNIMMYHKELAQQYHDDELSVRLSKLERIVLYFRSHFVQFDVALKLQLWQASCNCIANIQNLIVLSGCYPKPAKFAVYLEKAAMVFWKSNNIVFHTAALLQEFCMRKQADKAWFDKGNEKAVQLATRILLAILSISEADWLSMSAQYLDADDGIDRSHLIKSFFKRPGPPSKKNFIKEMMFLGVDLCAMPEMLEFYEKVQSVQNPLTIAQELQPYLRFIEEYGNPEYQQYLDRLYSMICIKILKQLSRVHKTIAMEKLYGLIPYFSEDRLERELVYASRRNVVHLRMNYLKKIVEFGSENPGISVEVEDEDIDDCLLDLPVVPTMPSVADIIENHFSKVKCFMNEVSSYMGVFQQSVFRTDSPENWYVELCEKIKLTELHEEYMELKRRLRLERTREKEGRIVEQIRLKMEKSEKSLEMERKRMLEAGKCIILEHLEEEVRSGKSTKSLTLSTSSSTLSEEEIESSDDDDESFIEPQLDTVDDENYQNANKLKICEKNQDCFANAMQTGEIALHKAEEGEKSSTEYSLWCANNELKPADQTIDEQEMRDCLTTMLEDTGEFMKDIHQRDNLENMENTKISKEEQQLNEYQQCSSGSDLHEISEQGSSKLGKEEQDKKPKVQELTRKIMACSLDKKRLSCRPNIDEIREMTWDEYLMLLKDDLSRRCLKTHRDPDAETFFHIQPVIRNKKKEISIFQSSSSSSSPSTSSSHQDMLKIYQVEVKYNNVLFVEDDGHSRKHECKFTFRNDFVKFRRPNENEDLPGKDFCSYGTEPPDNVPITILIGVNKRVGSGSEMSTSLAELHELVLCRKLFQQKSPKLMQIKNQPAFQFATVRCCRKSIAGLPPLSIIPENRENDDNDDADKDEDHP